ncbi:MAG: MGMT family protein [Planctomycetaceae bacterium]|nr:MGMT family protein [Planctomycetales bacterium]MCB9927654.1 MGMT family protein [Planctomycetaceae bacterium]
MARTPCNGGTCTCVFESDLGWMAIRWNEHQVSRLTFGHSSPRAAVQHLAGDEEPTSVSGPMKALIRRLQRFAAGKRDDDFLDVCLILAAMTPFQKAIIERCRKIPVGETLSYGQLADAAGYPGAARAVGCVMAKNRFPLIVPCHRVLASGGRIGGFSAPDGIRMKQRLLAPEQRLRRAR